MDVNDINKPYLPRESKSEEHGTPQALYDEYDLEFGFTLDAAASSDNAKCPKYYTKAQDGAAQPWKGETVFCNPPYNVRDLTRFADKAVEESLANKVTSVLLYPAKTDQQWFHTLWGRPNVEFRWIRGRLKFEGNKNSATFPSVVIVVRGVNDV